MDLGSPENLLQLLPSHWQHREKCALLKQKTLGYMFGNNSWFFPSHEFIFFPHLLIFFDKKCLKLVQCRIFSAKKNKFSPMDNHIIIRIYQHGSICWIDLVICTFPPVLSMWWQQLQQIFRASQNHTRPQIWKQSLVVSDWSRIHQEIN